ncbi:unnamed protein product [Schistosoma curassoni]|uniref:SCP2 domain-containing protein n=1 Tax=Schistosoma curassoni TaxID=6186 RepID=A0A183K1E6_9TREM|nr:unnamed protein product [Schistosoma curassoni]
MQITSNVAAASESVGLNLHKENSKNLKCTTENTYVITLDGEALEDIVSFTYLDSIIGEQGGQEADVMAKIDKTRATFLQLNNIWD